MTGMFGHRQRVETAAISSIRIRAMFNQSAHHLQSAVVGRAHERRHARPISGVYLSTLIQ
jgi:hypothetical protein